MTKEFEKIILIDDDKINNLINKEIIRQFNQNIEVVIFERAPEALDFFKKNPKINSCLILLDINMPIMNGWEFLQSFRNLSLKIPIFMLTSSIDDYDMEIAKKYAEVLSYIRKPLSVDKLKNSIALINSK
ncbi:MAG: response regulator [Microscillaceae bacterium]|nr:response regulator [Microscillaceae bacterium]MDW8461243.1 response regulator [Cytophagales bacterium]